MSVDVDGAYCRSSNISSRCTTAPVVAAMFSPTMNGSASTWVGMPRLNIRSLTKLRAPRSRLAPLVSNTTFRNDGLLIITFDESVGTDTQNGGGHVATVIVSPKAKAGFQSTTLYQHQSTLRLILQGLGVSNLPGASSSAPQMGEFF